MKGVNKITRFENSDDEENIHKAHSIGPTKWYNEVAADPKKFKPVTDELMIKLKDEAKKCWDADVAAFAIKNTHNNADYRWMKSIMSKGTVTDKIAANTVVIQNSPLCNLETLQSMVAMVKTSKKRECLSAMETLTELFLSDLLRPHAKLKPFRDRPLSAIDEMSSGNSATRKKLLSHWYFEDQLKETYTMFVRAVNSAAHDTVDSNKEKAISVMFKLLAGNPEQEKNLLINVVNKLGDPSQKVASKAMYCLNKLLTQHPNMQMVVLSQIEQLLFRANVTTRTQYYSLCFLSQYYLSPEVAALAEKLIDTYFAFFKACIKKDEVDSRMMSVLLTGVNRAYPYAKLEAGKISEHIDTIYRVVHVSNFNVSLQALNLLYQVSEFDDNINDRFYSALYRKLADTDVTTTSQQAILLNLIYKSMSRDTKNARIKAFTKRLLQIALTAQPNFTCGLLYLVSQIIHSKSQTQALRIHVTKSECDGIKSELASDEEEGASEGWTHRVEPKLEDKPKTSAPKNTYDPFNRNPLYSGAEFCCYTELQNLSQHYHPSVVLFANNILNGIKIVYTGDPLKDFTLLRFLERFVFKNPKTAAEMRKTVSATPFGQRRHYAPRGIKALPVGSHAYLTTHIDDIPVDEQFLHTYLFKKFANKTRVVDGSDDEVSDSDSVSDDKFEEMLSNLSEFKNMVDEDPDYMAEIEDNFKKDSKKSKRKAKSNKDEEETDDSDTFSGQDDDNDDDIDDLEEQFSDDDMEDLDDEENELMELDDNDDDNDDAMSDIVFDQSDDDEEIENTSKGNKGMAKNKKALVDKIKNSSLFAAADEFASLLEDEGNEQVAPGTASAFVNKDKSSVKQLAWEGKRDRWTKTKANKYKGKGKGGNNAFQRRNNQNTHAKTRTRSKSK